jgi:twitching motility protein PilU
LLNSAFIADLIKGDKIDAIRDAIEQSVSPGSQTFEQALYKLYKAGQISKEDALRNADSASNLSSLIDYSQTAKMKAFVPASSKAGAASTPSADFSNIKLDIKDADSGA